MGPELTEQFVIWVFGEVERLAAIVVQPEIPVQPTATSQVPVQPAMVSSQPQPVMVSSQVQPQSQPAQVQTQQTQHTQQPQPHPILGNDVQMSGNTNLKTNRSFSRALETAVNSKPAKPSPPAATSTTGRKTFSEESQGKKQQPARRSTRLQASAQPQRTVSRGDSRAVSTDEGGKVQKIRLSVDFERDERRQARKRFNDPPVGKTAVSAESEAPAIKVKCPYWPTCKLGAACPNIHPSETCKHFPNCAKGDACTFLHPAIPCRFQERCSNPNCNYQHRAPLAMAAASVAAIPMATVPSALPGLQPSTIQCRFYPRCVNPACPYLHPVKVPCRFGAACTRPDCHFEHPEGRKNVQLKSVVYAPCRYGKQCARVDCPFQHESTEPSGESAMQLEPSNPSTNTTNQ